MIARLRRRDDFRRLRLEGRLLRRGPLVIVYRNTDFGVRMAYAIPRAVGSAVTRNRIRRRLRAIMADLESRAELIPCGDYLVRVAPPAVGLSFSELKQHVHSVFEDLSQQP